MTKFAQWLDRIRRPQESERGFALRLGISAPTLRRIYEGRIPSNETLQNIAESDAHNLPEEEVFKLAGVIRYPRDRFDVTDQEMADILSDMESLRGTPMFKPTLELMRMVISVVMTRMDMPEQEPTRSNHQ